MGGGGIASLLFHLVFFLSINPCSSGSHRDGRGYEADGGREVFTGR